MQDREIICTYYIRHGECSKGRKAEHRGICQHCKYYVPLKGAKPARVNNRKKKIEQIRKKESGDY